ncbi:MAG TPA: DUF4212 domain-containing protein [Longimicrobiaceae bacterium]|jgi:putative solute:sodium symporter small subunit|nr:DUF4212 domain-containing protein [Longimicrobiaceae bacterium]
MSIPADFDREAYWKRTLRRTIVLLALWFIAGPLLGVLVVKQMNQFSIGGAPFGFWMAQQGAIYVFVAIVFTYAWRSNRADREAGVHETPETTRAAAADH